MYVYTYIKNQQWCVWLMEKGMLENVVATYYIYA